MPARAGRDAHRAGGFGPHRAVGVHRGHRVVPAGKGHRLSQRGPHGGVQLHPLARLQLSGSAAQRNALHRLSHRHPALRRKAGTGQAGPHHRLAVRHSGDKSVLIHRRHGGVVTHVRHGQRAVGPLHHRVQRRSVSGLEQQRRFGFQAGGVVPDVHQKHLLIVQRRAADRDGGLPHALCGEGAVLAHRRHLRRLGGKAERRLPAGFLHQQQHRHQVLAAQIGAGVFGQVRQRQRGAGDHVHLRGQRHILRRASAQRHAKRSQQKNQRQKFLFHGHPSGICRMITLMIPHKSSGFKCNAANFTLLLRESNRKSVFFAACLWYNNSV